MADVLAAPSEVTATASAYNTVVIAWTDGEAASVGIQRKASGGTYSSVAVVASGVQTYTDTTASGSTQYTYRVRHVAMPDTSAWVEATAVWTLPQPPSGLAGSYSGKTATLTWTNNGVAYTYIKTYYKATSDGSWTTDTETLTGTATTRNITVAAENTAYDFRIKGYYSSSTLDSDYNTVTSQTSGIMAPTVLEGVSNGSTQVGLTWTDNSSVEDGFEIYKDGTLLYTNSAGDTTYSATGLTSSTSYIFKVRAKLGTAYSAFTSELTIVKATPHDATPVIGTVAAVSSTSLTVTWTDTATNATRFYIYRSTDDVTYTEVTYVDSGLGTYTDTGLTDDTTYYYKVRAWNTGGYSSYTAAANGATSLDLDPPTDLVAEAVSSTQIKLTWTDNAPSADYHCIERKSGGSAYSEVGTVATGTATYTSGSLTAGTEYTFRIRARHDTPTTYGDYSAPITKTITAVGTESVRRNETYLGLSHIIGVVSETPQTSIAAEFRTKPMDFADQDPSCYNRDKTVKCVRLEYVDNYASVPVTVYVSIDDGEHWNSVSRYIGEADGTSKCADFYIQPLTGKYFTVKISSTSTITAFTWTGMDIEYILGGEHYENDSKKVSSVDDYQVYERGVVDGGSATSSYLDEETYD